MSNKEKRERVKQCFTLGRDFVEKLENISSKTGVPKSRVVESCFGDSDKLDDFEKFCASVNKRKQEGE